MQIVAFRLSLISADLRKRATELYFLIGVILSAVFQRYVPAEFVAGLFGDNRGFGVLMAALLILLMACTLVGEKVHEWMGIGMFILFILHHILNIQRCHNLFKGKYTPFRIMQTVLVVLALVSMCGSMVSGIILSRHALSFLPIRGGQFILDYIAIMGLFVFIGQYLEGVCGFCESNVCCENSPGI